LKKSLKKGQVARINFTAVKTIKEAMQKKPELEKKLRKDFSGTLKAEGIKVDDAFKKQVMKEWRATMKADIRKVVAENPKSKNWYLKRVIEGKPLKIHVKINRKTGKITKKLEGKP